MQKNYIGENIDRCKMCTKTASLSITLNFTHQNLFHHLKKKRYGEILHVTVFIILYSTVISILYMSFKSNIKKTPKNIATHNCF